MNPTVVATIQSNGDLYSLGWYLFYSPKNNEATLDGEFTADELRSIADYMEGKRP